MMNFRKIHLDLLFSCYAQLSPDIHISGLIRYISFWNKHRTYYQYENTYFFKFYLQWSYYMNSRFESHPFASENEPFQRYLRISWLHKIWTDIAGYFYGYQKELDSRMCFLMTFLMKNYDILTMAFCVKYDWINAGKSQGFMDMIYFYHSYLHEILINIIDNHFW